ARLAGGVIGSSLSKTSTLVWAQNCPQAAEVTFGMALRAYEFTAHKTAKCTTIGSVEVLSDMPETLATQASPMAALAEGVFFTRDLVNEPANILTTDDFAARLAAMQDLGLDVEILEEEEMASLGMGALLGVGQGSESASKLVVMRWNGGKKGEAPLALVGKGVVFDTGGISMKPALGLENMTMDMGGAGVVAGVMRSLALRKARANVVGLVGLVENMPDGRAQRPGDVVTSMKGTKIEVINTDAEGRLVLADVLWYAQETYNPCGIINLATLTGAIIVALGHENAGGFSNNTPFYDKLSKAAEAEGEGLWRMPLGAVYDAKLASRVADIVNSCGRDAGAVTAAQFLQRFVKPETPWIHLDIAGTAFVKTASDLAPKGATGWGVLALNRVIVDYFES
ncbi:MAG: leucyl aminopeptidase, partial [Paracoccaceae bacterium]